MSIEIRKWDAEKDILITDQEPLLSLSHPYITQIHSYYMNTAKGCYVYKTGFTEEKVWIQDLLLFDGENEEVVFKDASCRFQFQYHRLLFITTDNPERQYVVDSRGVLFDFTEYVTDRNKRELPVKIDYYKGYYVIYGKLKMYFRSRAQQAEYHECTKAEEEAFVNKKFNSFVRKNAHNENKYLYLTGGKSKCGMFLDHFISKGIEYEILPNLLIDDETINVRIPLFGDNAKRKEVHFLSAKYRSTYSIHHISLVEICCAMNLSFEIAKKYGIFFNVNPQKQILIFSIVNTLRSLYPEKDNDTVFKKILEKFLIIFQQTTVDDLSNDFSTSLLLYIEDSKMSQEYLKKQQMNICSLLNITNPSLLWDNTSAFWGFNRKMYIEAYSAAWKKRREMIQDYEAQVLQEIAADGKKVSRWVNEGDLYSMVVKHYSDAVFQFRADWLGLQSIDVFIPSLEVGLEYQGIQHFEPVDFFGGEEGFQTTQERDKRKAELCQQNGVTLIYWRYDEPISVSRLKTKLKEAGINTEK